VGDGFLQAYLLLGPDDRTLTIHIVSHYPTLPGVATLWDGMQFGFVGDIMGLTTQPVKFPGAMAFKLAPAAIHMPTLATMEAQWIATRAMSFLPPFGLANANMELVCTWCSALLLFVAVHCCLTPMSM